MQFTLLQMLTSLVLLSAFLGYALTTGIGVAILFAVLAALTWACITRLRARWQDANLLQRSYASATALGSCALLVIFIVGVATSPTIACERNVVRLRSALASTDEFANISVDYMELKCTLLRVDGTVGAMRDFDALRKRVHSYDWPDMDDVYWNVTVSDTGDHFDGWGGELFPDSNP